MINIWGYTRKIVFAFLILFCALICLSGCSTNQKKISNKSNQPSLADKTDSNTLRYITYEDAYEQFKEFYSLGHASYIEKVELEVEDYKSKIIELNEKILEKLELKYNAIAELGQVRSDADYNDSYIVPYREYFNSRLDAGNEAYEGYLGVSTIVSYGGNVAGDSSLLWEYVYYHNFYSELCDLNWYIGQ